MHNILAVVLNAPVRCELPSIWRRIHFNGVASAEKVFGLRIMQPHRAGRTSHHASGTPRMYQDESANQNELQYHAGNETALCCFVLFFYKSS